MKYEELVKICEEETARSFAAAREEYENGSSHRFLEHATLLTSRIDEWTQRMRKGEVPATRAAVLCCKECVCGVLCGSVGVKYRKFVPAEEAYANGLKGVSAKMHRKALLARLEERGYYAVRNVERVQKSDLGARKAYCERLCEYMREGAALSVRLGADEAAKLWLKALQILEAEAEYRDVERIGADTMKFKPEDVGEMFDLVKSAVAELWVANEMRKLKRGGKAKPAKKAR